MNILMGIFKNYISQTVSIHNRINYDKLTQSEFCSWITLGDHLNECFIGFTNLFYLAHPQQPLPNFVPLAEILPQQHQKLNFIIGTDICEGRLITHDELLVFQEKFCESFESKFHIFFCLFSVEGRIYDTQVFGK